jgi:hypothetical protein
VHSIDFLGGAPLGGGLAAHPTPATGKP